MDRYNRIINNKSFVAILEELRYLEADRIFCRHGLGHLLDVCRIAYILNLENDYGYDKDVIYAAGLLHDIGRVRQYRYGEDHHTAGLADAGIILDECGYSDDEKTLIISAISAHKSLPADNESMEGIFAGLLYEADKKSRNCFMCKAYMECNWSEDKKNKGVI